MRRNCFRWHPDARAFAGTTQIAKQSGAPTPVIPAHPVADALSQIGKALDATTAFCVGDLASLDTTALGTDQFATLTGGTSGPPKVIARTQASWISSFDANMAQFNYTANDSIAVLGALGHSLALYGVLEALHLGLGAHAMSPLPPSGQIAQLRKHGCTILYATPTQLRLLPEGTQLPDLRLILCGGGTLNGATRQHIAALCPNAQVHVFYGAAETSFVTLGDDTTPQTSVGRAYGDVRIEIRARDDTGNGTIWVNSPYLFDGYLQGDSPHTQRDGDWITVGERGRLDAQGNLFLQGRAGRSVNIADQTVYLDQLEAQLGTATHIPPCVMMVRADRLRGHHVIAVVEGAPDATLCETLRAHCKARGLHSPRDVVFLDPLPQLPSGKPDLQRIATLTGAVP